MNWGQIQVLYYVLVVGAALIVNGSPLVAVLAAFLAWGFEPSFKAFVAETWGIKTDADRVKKPVTATASASAGATSKAKAKTTSAAKPKTAKPKAAAKPKPKPDADEDD